MRLSLLLSTAAAATLMAGSALAADLGMRAAPVPSYAPTPLYNWTGFNVGVHGGYLWGDADISGFSTPAISDIDLDSAFGGIQLGYLWQSNALVFGIETDFSLTDGSGSSYYFTGEGLSVDLDWFGTVRGKVGYAIDNVLIYGTGGLAYGHISVDEIFFGDGASKDTTKLGWTAGAGIDWAFAKNWTVGLEYRYMDFGSVGFTPNFFDQTDVDVTSSTVRLNVNYKF